MNGADKIRSTARTLAHATGPVAATDSAWRQRWLNLKKDGQRLFTLIDRAPAAADAPVETALAKDAWNWLKENPRTIRNAILEIDDRLEDISELPRSACGPGVCPRVFAIAQGLLPALDYTWQPDAFRFFLEMYQDVRPLQSNE